MKTRQACNKRSKGNEWQQRNTKLWNPNQTARENLINNENNNEKDRKLKHKNGQKLRKVTGKKKMSAH